MECSKIHDTIVENIKNVMKENGYKSKNVSSQLGWTPMTYSNLLNGRRTLKSEYLPYIAKAIGCDVNRLFEGTM